jgi:hypothetical protein
VCFGSSSTVPGTVPGTRTNFTHHVGFMTSLTNKFTHHLGTWDLGFMTSLTTVIKYKRLHILYYFYYIITHFFILQHSQRCEFIRCTAQYSTCTPFLFSTKCSPNRLLTNHPLTSSNCVKSMLDDFLEKLECQGTPTFVHENDS